MGSSGGASVRIVPMMHYIVRYTQVYLGAPNGMGGRLGRSYAPRKQFLWAPASTLLRHVLQCKEISHE